MLDIETVGGRPLYKQIRDGLRQRIISGDLTAGVKLPSDAEVCSELGVGTGTVQWAYRELVREGILIRKPGPMGGTFVAKSVPSPKSYHSSREVGVLLYDTVSVHGEEYMYRIMNGSSEVATELGYNIHLFATKDRSILNGNDMLFHSIAEKTIGGLLLLAHWREVELRALQETGCPFVVIDNDYVNLDVPFVRLDDRKVTADAVRILTDKGHKKIALMTNSYTQAAAYTRDRNIDMHEVYTSRLQELGLSWSCAIHKEKIGHGDSLGNLTERVDRMLDEATAVIADGNWTAKHTISRMQEKRLSVGKDIDLFIYGDGFEVPGGSSFRSRSGRWTPRDANARRASRRHAA